MLECRLARFAAAVLVVMIGIAARAASAAASPAPANEAMVEEFLAKKGWSRGFNPDGRLVIVKTQPVPVPREDRRYLDLRGGAFDRAMSDAGAEAAEALSQKISSQLEAKSDIAEVLGDPALALAWTGIAEDEAFRQTEELNEVLKTVAGTRLAGLYAAQTFETPGADGRGSITVIATVSPGSLKSVEDALRRGPSDGPAKWFAAIPAPEVARTYGIRFFPDADGILHPVSVHQAALGEPASLERATSMAKTNATKHLAKLRGAVLTSQALTESMSRLSNAAGAGAKVAELRNLLRMTRTQQEVSNSDLGVQVVGEREVTDPTTGLKMVVVALTAALPRAAQGEGNPNLGAVPPKPVPANCPPIPEDMAEAVRQVTSTGRGKSRNEAVESALLDAIRMDGARVSGSSLLKRQFEQAIEGVDDEVRRKVSDRTEHEDTVETFADGFVYSFGVIEERAVDGGPEVTLCANLVRFDPKSPRFGLPPTVAVIAFACAPGAVAVGGAQADGAGVTGQCERAFDREIGAMREAFMLIEERDAPVLEQLRDQIRRRVDAGEATQAEALKLGRALTADFVVLGTVVRASFSGAPDPRPRIEAADVATATISASLVNVATGEVAWSEESTVTLKGRDLLLVRTGRGLLDPQETGFAPLQLATFRACRELLQSFQRRFPPPDPK